MLVDSNLDWGQDYPQIADLLKKNGKPEIIVACLGNGDRDHYLGPHQDLIAWEPESPNPDLYRHVNSAAPRREWLIVSASFLQGFGLADPQLFAWLRGRRPLARPGYSSFVYDVSSDGLSQFNIGQNLSTQRPSRARAAAVRAGLRAGTGPALSVAGPRRRLCRSRPDQERRVGLSAIDRPR